MSQTLASKKSTTESAYLFVRPEEARALSRALSKKPDPAIQTFLKRMRTNREELNLSGHQAYAEKAKELFEREGSCEVDENPLVSISDDKGAYVMAWLWVSDGDLDLPDED
jgi:hypothetical protein